MYQFTRWQCSFVCVVRSFVKYFIPKCVLRIMGKPVAYEDVTKMLSVSYVLVLGVFIFWISTTIVEIFYIKETTPGFIALFTYVPIPICVNIIGLVSLHRNLAVRNYGQSLYLHDSLSHSFTIISCFSFAMVLFICIFIGYIYHLTTRTNVVYYALCISIYFIMILDTATSLFESLKVFHNGLATRDIIESFLDVNGNDDYYE